MLTADQADGRYSIIDEIFKVGLRSFVHTHAYHSETFLVIDGEMKWTVGGETQIVGPGDMIDISPYTPHVAVVARDKDVHAIMIYESGGYEHGLLRRVSASSEERKDPEYRRRMMKLSDVVPLSAQGRDFDFDST
jgi:quercetin dioxygenase-like cupin family protein